MKILVTGSSGFVGKHLVKKLSNEHTIIEYDLVNREDVLDRDLLTKKLEEVDVVVHLAAFISAVESWEKPLEYFRNNTLGTASVVDCAIKSGVKKIIFFSSAAVKAEPFTPYAISKINAEKILDLYKNEINAVIVRPENIYGPGQKESYGYVIHNFIKAVKHGKPIKIYGDGKQTRDFIFIKDVVSVVNNLLMNKDIKSGSIVSLGTGKETRIIDLAKLVMKVMGKKTKIDFLSKREEPLKSVADTKTLKSLKINANKFITLEKGIGKLLHLQYEN